MSLEISRVDPFDDATVDEWWDAYAEAERADRAKGTPVWTREETRRELQQDSSAVERRTYLLRSGGECIGAASLALPLKDNTHVAHLGLGVPPRHRRRGYGSHALAFLEGEAVTAGRTTAQSTTSWLYELGPDGSGSPGREFARRHGYSLALGDVQNRLDLPVDPALLDRLQAGVPDEGYTLRSWIGPVPDDVVEGWASLDASIETEAPSGELDIEPATPDVAGIRETEDLLVLQHRISFGTVALASDGAVAAYTQIVVSGDDGNAYQWGTLVRREDRGHRLGTAVKVANLRMLQHESPGTPCVYTYNAESNAHMLAVNTLLGFRPRERMGELQKRLS
ncbi:GNAT family N-acetyltransferase [Microbacterium sp. OVT16B]|uniref:GNAT family N-acetyltransferase n=1 Tax=Microbacterium sp. OVT16B TaxID=2862682 RepID=UPI001CBE65EC|nr:GNAT family N-acetyltransferase [Microbacterium sp. OVT16B]